MMVALLTQCSGAKKVFKIHDYTPFGVCYAKVTPDQVKNYQMVIVEPDFYTKEEFAALKLTGTKIIAYSTLGEVDGNRWYYPMLEKEGFLGINENWNSAFINLEKNQVRELILNKVLPEIMQKGADGLFLDTIDAVSPETERGYLKPYMVQLIREIRARYPDKIIIQNAGLFLLDQTKEVIDAFLTEDLASNYDFDKKEYNLRPAGELNERLSVLNEYAQESERPYFIIDFADTDANRKQLRSQLDTLGRPYFISNIELSELPVIPDSVSNTLRKSEK